MTSKSSSWLQYKCLQEVRISWRVPTLTPSHARARDTATTPMFRVDVRWPQHFYYFSQSYFLSLGFSHLPPHWGQWGCGDWDSQVELLLWKWDCVWSGKNYHLRLKLDIFYLFFNFQETLTCNFPDAAFPCEESPSLYGAVEFGKIPDDY